MDFSSVDIPCGGEDKQAATAVNPEKPPQPGSQDRWKGNKFQPLRGGFKNIIWIRSWGNPSLQMTPFVGPFSQMTSLVPNVTRLNMPFMSKEVW